jgi:small subunit ribosomal protein S5
VIAGGAARAVLEAAGVRDVLTKSLGSATQINVVQATMDALKQMRSVEEIARERGVPEARVMPFWRRRTS